MTQQLQERKLWELWEKKVALNIRTAGHDDLQTILSLYEHLHRKELTLAQSIAKENFKQIVNAWNLDIFIAEEGGTPAASCYLNIIGFKRKIMFHI